ncbi:hypothetical protein [Novosphingobium sp.]|uniref:hypothetical protein n=1 Tax=Novosphingobium sp. TaxID=1874826 RepID=UPI0025F6378C|nr:hypothetical protein [Novosphingobium sp.]MCC6926173.1 hypothetical protein [Novosphingobium sp.]
MAYKPSEQELNRAYQKGYEDARSGRFNPPKGDALVDTIFAPLDRLAGSPSTRERADALAAAYRAGHAAWGRR